MSSSPSQSVAIASVLVAMLSFQAGASVAKQLIPVIGAPGTTALRLGLSALIVALLQRPWRDIPSRSAWPTVLIFGLALGAMNFVFYMAIRTIPLGIAVALEFTGPLAVSFAASRHRTEFLWVTLAAIGVFFLLPIAPRASGLDPIGVLYALAAGLGWALYIVFGKRAGRVHGPSASTWGMIIAAILVVPGGVALTGPAILSPLVLVQGLAVAILSSALPYTLEMIGLRRLTTKAFGTLMSLEPAFAALTGLVVLRERLSAEQWLAIGAVIVASIGMVGSDRRT